MIFSIPSYDNNVTSDLDIISSDRMFLTFGKLGNASRSSLIGPLPPPDSTAILVYDRHRNAWLDPLIIYECVGVPFQILPFHEPLQFHLLCRFVTGTVQKVTCAISENMQSVRITEAESLFTNIGAFANYRDANCLKVCFESDLPLLAYHEYGESLIIYKIHDGMAVETNRLSADRICCVNYANRKLDFLDNSDYGGLFLLTFNIDSSELMVAEGLKLGIDPYADFCFGNGKLFRCSSKDEMLYVYELAAPYATREVCLIPIAGEIKLVHSLDGQIWIRRACVDCYCVMEIVSVWYEPPPLYDIALRAVHKNLSVAAKRTLRKSVDPPLFNYELLVDFVLSYQQHDDLSENSSDNDIESPRCCDCEKHHYDWDDDCSELGGYVETDTFGTDADGYFLDSDFLL